MIYFFVRKQGGKEDILSRFLIESNTDPENMTDKYLRDITLSFVIAGKDTSAGTLTWFFYMLCKHPLIQEKAAQEVRAATKTENNLCTDEFHDRLTEAALDKMQYLHAALTETLRLYTTWLMPWEGCYQFGERMLRNFDRNDGLTMVYLNLKVHLYLLLFRLEFFFTYHPINISC